MIGTKRGNLRGREVVMASGREDETDLVQDHLGGGDLFPTLFNR